jgi:hypothetical protein
MNHVFAYQIGSCRISENEKQRINPIAKILGTGKPDIVPAGNITGNDKRVVAIMNSFRFSFLSRFVLERLNDTKRVIMARHNIGRTIKSSGNI